jgi:hypothetical protein
VLPCFGCGREVKLQDIAKHVHEQCDVLVKALSLEQASTPQPPLEATPTHARKAKSKPKSIAPSVADGTPVDSPSAAVKSKLQRRLQPVDESSPLSANNARSDNGSVDSPMSSSSPQKRRHRHRRTTSDALSNSVVPSPLSVGGIDLKPDSATHASRPSPESHDFAVTLEDLMTSSEPASVVQPAAALNPDRPLDILDDVDTLATSLVPLDGGVSGIPLSVGTHRPVGVVVQRKLGAQAAVEDHDDWALEASSGKSVRVEGDFIRRTGLSGAGEAIGGNKTIRKFKE